MNRYINRRRFLELSASMPALAPLGGTFEGFSPQVSHITFAATATRGIYDIQPASNWSMRALSTTDLMNKQLTNASASEFDQWSERRHSRRYHLLELEAL